MKKLLTLLTLVLTMSAFACGAAEDIDSTQQAAMGACTRPTGSVGSVALGSSSIGYITGIHVASRTSALSIQWTKQSTGAQTSGLVDFGSGQALMSGGGWYGNKVKLIAEMAMPCNTLDPVNLKCWKITGFDGSIGFINFDKRVSAFQFENESFWFGDGLLKIGGTGLTDPQTMKFWFKQGAKANDIVEGFAGPALDTCAIPG